MIHCRVSCDECSSYMKAEEKAESRRRISSPRCRMLMADCCGLISQCAMCAGTGKCKEPRLPSNNSNSMLLPSEMERFGGNSFTDSHRCCSDEVRRAVPNQCSTLSPYCNVRNQRETGSATTGPCRADVTDDHPGTALPDRRSATSPRYRCGIQFQGPTGARRDHQGL
jgi:hypothetical protein